MNAAFQKKAKGEQDSRRKSAREHKKKPSNVVIVNPATDLGAVAVEIRQAVGLGDSPLLRITFRCQIAIVVKSPRVSRNRINTGFARDLAGERGRNRTFNLLLSC